MWGRENVRIDRDVEVTEFEPRQLAITWRGAPCDSNTTLVIEGTAADLRIRVVRGLAGDCSGSSVVYDSILELNADVPADSIEVDLVSRRSE